MLSVSYSLEILIAKAIHPARTTLQVIISPIPACSPLPGPSIFASCHALSSQQFDRLASTAWLTSTLVLFYLNPTPPPPHLNRASWAERSAGCSSASRRASNFRAGISFWLQSHVLVLIFCLILALDAFQIGWPCDSVLKKEDFLFYR